MKLAKNNAFTLQIYSYVILAVGILNMVFYYMSIFLYGFPHNLGIAIGNCAILFLGVITSVIAKIFGSLERRLDSLENRN